jgi:KDO2-lipid IV(A) lauroyltransferase
LVIIPISLLPFSVLYLFSDLLYVVLYHFVSYRKEVVIRNIRKSFPHLSHKEHIEIMKKFYVHLCDVIVETFKSFTISGFEIRRRMVLQNPELLNSYYRKGKSLILAGGHYNNWEWIATGIDQQIEHHSIAIYKTLSNKFFDQKMRSTRGKFGLEMISTKRVAEVLAAKKNDLTATIFAIDQSPSNPKKAHWITFLNQDTACLYGTEKYAKEMDFPVLYGVVTKVKRGFYTFRFEVVTDMPQETRLGWITEKTNKLLEDDIIAKPEFWLWTHKRWKHKRPID